MSISSIQVKQFLPADQVIITGNRECAELACHNQVAGPGFTIMDGNRPIACGGIRVVGVGIAWFAMTEEARTNNPMLVIRKAKKKIEEMQRQQELCELFAESRSCDKWLEHLGFHKVENIFLR